MRVIRIDIADLNAPDLITLLNDHVAAAGAQQATHVYGLERLRRADITVFTARDTLGALMGCAAMKRLDETEGEIKSVRTHDDHLRKGVSSALMAHLTDHAKACGLSRLSLETHPTPDYVAARRFYEKLGFTYCPPFGDYTDEPNSVFMTKAL